MRLGKHSNSQTPSLSPTGNRSHPGLIEFWAVLHFGIYSVISSVINERGGNWCMAMIAVFCPECQSCNVVKAGKQPNGTQRYRCQNPPCPRTIFQLAYVAHGRLVLLCQFGSWAL